MSVLGASADDLSLIGRGIGATGPLRPGEYARSAAGTAALALPPSDPSLALFERLLSETGLPGARAVWSTASADPAPPFLPFDRSRDERDTVQSLVDWFAGRLAA